MTLSKRRSEYPITVYPPDAIGDGSQTVTTAGTRVQLTTTSTACKKVLISGKGANTGSIFVGGATVAAGRGKAIVALQDVWIEIDDLSKVYIDASVSGEGCEYVYLS